MTRAKMANLLYEHSEQVRAPHTNGPRDVPIFGRGSEFTTKAAAPHRDSKEFPPGLNLKLWILPTCATAFFFFYLKSSLIAARRYEKPTKASESSKNFDGVAHKGNPRHRFLHPVNFFPQ